MVLNHMLHFARGEGETLVRIKKKKKRRNPGLYCLCFPGKRNVCWLFTLRLKHPRNRDIDTVMETDTNILNYAMDVGNCGGKPMGPTFYYFEQRNTILFSWFPIWYFPGPKLLLLFHFVTQTIVYIFFIIPRTLFNKIN